jgi:CspA family cold shock protein
MSNAVALPWVLDVLDKPLLQKPFRSLRLNAKLFCWPPAEGPQLFPINSGHIVCIQVKHRERSELS